MSADRQPFALVTGAASGIGRAIALRLCADGFRVLAVDRDADGLRALSKETHGTILWSERDLADLERLEDDVRDLVVEHGPPDALVNAAGVALVATVLEADLAAWQRVLDINLTAPMLLARATIPAMIEHGGGSIVNIASVAAFRGVRQRAAYCAAKAALVGLTRSITADFAGQGIRANAVCPGTVETNYTQAVLAVADDPDATRAFMTNRQLIGRMGTPDEIAGLVSYLVSDQASFMHGAAVIIDGGRSVL